MSTDTPINKHYGYFISLPAREFFKMQMESFPAKEKVDICIAYGDQVRTYTFDEFLFLLGLTTEVPQLKREEKPL